jgi:hypothetical protein
MSVSTNQDQLLRAIADAAARDIKDDFPHMDVMYDLYVETMKIRLWGKTRPYTIGLIDMGEAFQAAYVWVNDQWEFTGLLDPIEIREMIINKRSAG